MEEIFDRAYIVLEEIKISSPETVEALEQFRIQYLGTKSVLKDLFGAMAQLPSERKKEYGQLMNMLKAAAEKKFEELKVMFETSKPSTKEIPDLTAPGFNMPLGTRHPLSIVKNRIIEIFSRIGFTIAEGPEIEDDWHNFTALNTPQDHPARDMQDTFFVQPLEAKLVLRTHTSPVQIRTMLEQRPPIYVICPGKTYRADELDATHSPVFHQVEGLVVDKGITMAHLKGTLDNFAQAMFGPDVTTRLRPSFFPFTEPSAEVDIFFNGRWIEWGGCGMVNPKVLQTCGIDTDIYTGFAFGMGLERTLMVRHNITDMHDIVEGDLRFTRQFGVGL